MARAPESFTAMKTRHLECRHLNHAWKLRTAVVMGRGEVECEFSCSRCTGVRVDKYRRRDGQLVSRRYVYPGAYLVRDLKRGWGGRKTFNGNVRAELIGRYVKGRS